MPEWHLVKQIKPMENLKDKTRQDKQDGQDIILSVAMENKFSILLNRTRLFIFFILFILSCFVFLFIFP